MSTVLITGANRGIGLEFTRQYAEDGWTVIACCRDPDGESAEDLRAIARASEGRVSIEAMDMLDHGSIVETGDHAALLARDGEYRRLYREQFERLPGGAAPRPATA